MGHPNVGWSPHELATIGTKMNPFTCKPFLPKQERQILNYNTKLLGALVVLINKFVLIKLLNLSPSKFLFASVWKEKFACKEVFW